MYLPISTELFSFAYKFFFCFLKKLIFFWVMLTCASRAHDKLPKSRKLAFNDVKYLMF
jgi:hypothetical protein